MVYRKQWRNLTAASGNYTVHIINIYVCSTVVMSFTPLRTF